MASLRPEPASERVARELTGAGRDWTPVPVPPPTYTMKPAAPRPEPTTSGLPGAAPSSSDRGCVDQSSGEAAEVRSARPWDEDPTWADDLDLDAVLARRRAVND
jgi:hypothetical protein